MGKLCRLLFLLIVGLFFMQANVKIVSAGFLADVNGDGITGSEDFSLLRTDWKSTAKPPADINQDGIVNSVDLGMLMSLWMERCNNDKICNVGEYHSNCPDDCSINSSRMLTGFQFEPKNKAGRAWLVWYHDRDVKYNVTRDLEELVEKTGISSIYLFILIPDTLNGDGTSQAQAPPASATSIEQWARMQTMENIVSFLDFCAQKGISVQMDLANNMWIPYSVDTGNHVCNISYWWPCPDETPWDESIVWYTQTINYVESGVKDKNSIAMWIMDGNHQFGGAEPFLWDNPGYPEVNSSYVEFMRRVWPAFVNAGTRPKASPTLLPIFATPWVSDDPNVRLSAISNTKEVLVDELHTPPDYWPITSYTKSDPATDGYYYLKGIRDIIGAQDADKIILTDFKGPGNDEWLVLNISLINKSGMTDAEMYNWTFDKIREYGFGGWWIWAYRDSEDMVWGTSGLWGIRNLSGCEGDRGCWREDRVEAITDETRGI